MQEGYICDGKTGREVERDAIMSPIETGHAKGVEVDISALVGFRKSILGQIVNLFFTEIPLQSIGIKNVLTYGA